MNRNVRKITEGAMMVALYGMILFLNRQFAGMLEVYFAYLLPIPLVVFSAKYGWKNSLIVCASVFFLAFMLAMPQTWFYVVVSMMVGTTYGALVNHKAKNGVLLLVTMGVSIVSNVLTTVLFASFFGYNLTEELVMMNDIMVAYMGEETLGMLPFDLMNFLKIMLVFAAILNGIMEGALVHMISNVLLKRLKFEVRPFKKLVDWIVPKWTGYLAFTVFSCGLLSNYVTINETARYVILVMQAIAMIYLLVFGFGAIVIYGAVVYKKNISLLVVLLSLFFFTFAVPFLCVIGFIYITTDMRDQILARRQLNE